MLKIHYVLWTTNISFSEVHDGNMQFVSMIIYAFVKINYHYQWSPHSLAKWLANVITVIYMKGNMTRKHDIDAQKFIEVR